LHRQAIGGLVQGLGGAFLEHLVYDANGQLLAGNLADYLVPTASDFPNIRAIAIENYRSPLQRIPPLNLSLYLADEPFPVLSGTQRQSSRLWPRPAPYHACECQS
jgi:hypothetical protein